jgi:hypothetical protein
VPAHEQAPFTHYPVTDVTPPARLRVTELPSFVVCCQYGAAEDRAAPPGWVMASASWVGICPDCQAVLAMGPA